MNFCRNVDSLQRRKRSRNLFLVSSSRAKGSLWRAIDGTGQDYFKTCISFAQFEADADTTAPCADGIAASRAILPLEEAAQRAAAQDFILLESDAKR
jgi:hypothetical protein